AYRQRSPYVPGWRWKRPDSGFPIAVWYKASQLRDIWKSGVRSPALRDGRASMYAKYASYLAIPRPFAPRQHRRNAETPAMPAQDHPRQRRDRDLSLPSLHKSGTYQDDKSGARWLSRRDQRRI